MFEKYHALDPLYTADRSLSSEENVSRSEAAKRAVFERCVYDKQKGFSKSGISEDVSDPIFDVGTGALIW